MIRHYSYIEDIAQKTLINNNLYTAGFDIKELANSLKIQLIAENMSADVAGFFVMKNNIPVISYNKKANARRTRFTIAHEIGHFLLHSKTQPIFIDKTPTTVYFRNSVSTTGEILKEREANAFAAALLMPQALIAQEIGHISGRDVEQVITELARKFDVSDQAMSFRLSNLGYDIG